MPADVVCSQCGRLLGRLLNNLQLLICLQDLVLHQQQSTWGKLLLRDIPASQVPQELLKLDEAAQRIEARQGRGLYGSVQQVPPAAVIAAARAARAAVGAGDSLFESSLQQQRQRQWQQRAVQRGDVSSPLPAAPAPAAAAAAEGKAASSEAAAPVVADELEPKPAARHMFDNEQLAWFGQEASASTTGKAGKG
jgi:hypothetical protein